MRVVAALGGNALLGRDQAADVEVQRCNIAVAVRALAELAAQHAIERAHGTATAHALATATSAELMELDLPEGSMGPKAEAAARFAQATGRLAAIGALQDASALLAGRAGTRVIPERPACTAGGRAEASR